MGVRTSLRRYHVWLGWLVGLPFLFWTVSGLVMVAKPIEEVRGTALIAEPKPLALAARADRSADRGPHCFISDAGTARCRAALGRRLSPMAPRALPIR